MAIVYIPPPPETCVENRAACMGLLKAAELHFGIDKYLKNAEDYLLRRFKRTIPYASPIAAAAHIAKTRTIILGRGWSFTYGAVPTINYSMTWH